MSITSEINRISGNISDSLSAVATKGITVPSGSNSDDLAGLIAQIPNNYSVTLNLTGASSSASGTKVISGGSYFTEITPTTSGHKISSITVTMDGVDITSQVFVPGVGEKLITANGIYNASSDNMSGYSPVYVQVPDGGGGVTPTGTKQISITANGTTTEDVTNYASAEITVNVPSPTAPEITVTTAGDVSQALQPDTVYHFTSTALTSLTLTFAGTATDQYHFDFISPATAVTLNLPASVSMESSFNVEANTKYEIDIVNGEGVYAEWAVSS